MALSMKEKAKGFGALKPAQPADAGQLAKTEQPALASPVARPPKSAVSMHVDSVYRDQALANENLLLKTRLEGFDGALAVRALDPNDVHRSQWANRNDAEYLTPEFRALQNEIGDAGGNVQPIKVRVRKPVVDGQPVQYEVVYGHRRHTSCLNLGLKVNAIIEEDMDDRSLFETMDRENRGRKNLSAWEQGSMYQAALDKGLYSSGRRLEEALGLNHSDFVRALQLAKLPKAIVAAFASPLDLQYRWAKALADSLQRDPDAALAVASEIASNRGKLSAKEIFLRLTGSASTGDAGEIPILVRGAKVALFRIGAKGSAVIEFSKGTMTHQRQTALLKLIADYLEGG